MVVKHKSHHSRAVHVHHSMANFLLPVGLAIFAVLAAYIGQFQPLFFHQALYWLIGFGIMFAALHVLFFKKKIVRMSE